MATDEFPPANTVDFQFQFTGKFFDPKFTVCNTHADPRGDLGPLVLKQRSSVG